MLSPAIIVYFNVIKKSLLRLGHILKFTMINHLCFDRMEKRFCHRVIPAVAFATHALLQLVIFDHLAKRLGKALADAVIEQTRSRWSESPGGVTAFANLQRAAQTA